MKEVRLAYFYAPELYIVAQSDIHVLVAERRNSIVAVTLIVTRCSNLCAAGRLAVSAL